MTRTESPGPWASRRLLRPEVFGLESRELMAGGATATFEEARLFVREIARSIAASPVPEPLIRRLEVRVAAGDLTRAAAVGRLMATPQAQAGLVQGRYQTLLDRDPTPAELRRLTAGLRSGFDAPWVNYRIARSGEYFRTRGGGTDAGFIRAATDDLLHREATPAELVDLGGRTGRDRWLRNLLASDEYRGAQVDFQRQRYSTEPIGAAERARYLNAYRGPKGYSRAFARILGFEAGARRIVDLGRYRQASGPLLDGPPPIVRAPVPRPGPVVPRPARTVDAAPLPIRSVPALAGNPGLPVKRVPGFLAGWKQDNLAAPYNVANVAERAIDDRTVDYWAVTLNLADAVGLTILPTDGNPATDYLIRLWGPDDSLIGSTADGDLEYSAPAAGTYTIGISLKGNAGYPFDPTGPQPTPSGPSLHAFTAEFSTFPGPNTNIVDILRNYSNPAYTDNRFPAWVGGQAAAYTTLTTIAAAGSAAGVPDFRNFTDFRQVGNQTDPGDISGWLTAAWAPFQTILADPNNPQIVDISFRMTYGYTLDAWTPIATAFLNDPATQAAYASVNALLENANIDRQNISTFLANFQGFVTLSQININKDANLAAQELLNGATNLQVSQPSRTNSFWDDLINVVGGIIEGVAGVIDPALGIVADGVVSGIVPIIEDYLDGPSAPPNMQSQPDLISAADTLDTAALNAFTMAFELLSDPALIASIFSDYGRLEALGDASFAYSAGNNPLPSGNSLRRAYDASAYEQLLPLAFKWESLTDTALGDFDGLIHFFPDTYGARFDYPRGVPVPDGHVWRDPDCGPRYCTAEFNFDNGAGSLQAATDMVVALQNGRRYLSPNDDFTPRIGSELSFGPGPVTSLANGSLGLLGKPQRFYTTSLPGSAVNMTYQRTTLPGGQGYFTSATSYGTFVQEWALVNSQKQEISPGAAQKIFGTIPAGGLSLNQPDAQRNGAGYYLDFMVPPDGLVSRYDVFTTWGQDVPGFAFSSLTPINRDFQSPFFVPQTTYGFFPLTTVRYDTSYATG